MKRTLVVLATIVCVIVGCGDTQPEPATVDVNPTYNLRYNEDRIKILEALYQDAELCKQRYKRGFDSSVRRAEIIAIQTQILWQMKIEMDGIHEHIR